MIDERGKLVSHLVRTQALLWSAETPASKQRLRALIQEIEKRIAAFDGVADGPAARPVPAPKLGSLRR